eukprot:3767668-Rhodomonas_salina.2
MAVNAVAADKPDDFKDSQVLLAAGIALDEARAWRAHARSFVETESVLVVCSQADVGCVYLRAAGRPVHCHPELRRPLQLWKEE